MVLSYFLVIIIVVFVLFVYVLVLFFGVLVQETIFFEIFCKKNVIYALIL